MAMFQRIKMGSFPLGGDRDSASPVPELLEESEHVTFNETPEQSSWYRGLQDQDVDKV